MLSSIIIPTYNEDKTILEILKKINKVFLDSKVSFEIIIVNDCSKDNTLELLEKNRDLYSTLINNKKNIGKGGSVIEALKVAKGEYIFFQDADNEYNPDDFTKFLKVINLFNPDLIIGSRFKCAEYTRSNYLMNKIGNILITNFFNILFNTTFTDIYTCYIVFKKNYIDPKELRALGFEQQAEILGKIVHKGKKFYEVPISYNGRTFEEGKKIRFYDFFKVIYQIIKARFF